MNSKLKKQIGRYSGIAGMFLISDIADGQIVYVDLNPDVTVSNPQNWNNPYNLDVNSDGIVDIQVLAKNLLHSIICSSGSAHSCYAINYDGLLIALRDNLGNYNQNEIMYSATFCGSPIAERLSQNDSISANFPRWINGFASIETYDDCTSGWLFGLDRFAGFRIKVNNQFYYGWINVKAVSSQKIILKSYAYNSKPNKPITAGQTASPPIHVLNKPWLNTDRIGNNFTLNIENSTGISKIRVSNLLGQVIISREIHGNDFEFNLNEKGIYFLEVINNNVKMTKKIFVY